MHVLRGIAAGSLRAAPVLVVCVVAGRHNELCVPITLPCVVCRARAQPKLFSSGLFAAFDANGNGDVDLEEFLVSSVWEQLGGVRGAARRRAVAPCACSVPHARQSMRCTCIVVLVQCAVAVVLGSNSEERLRLVFHVYCRDRSGRLRYDDLVNAYQLLNWHRNPTLAMCRKVVTGIFQAADAKRQDSVRLCCVVAARTLCYPPADAVVGAAAPCSYHWKSG
jgi:hypothetical protein